MARRGRKVVSVELAPGLYQDAVDVSALTGLTLRELVANGLLAELQTHLERGEVRQTIETMRACRERLITP